MDFTTILSEVDETPPAFYLPFCFLAALVAQSRRAAQVNWSLVDTWKSHALDLPAMRKTVCSFLCYGL